VVSQMHPPPTRRCGWLQERGIAPFVLKYRIMEKRQPGIPAKLPPMFSGVGAGRRIDARARSQV